MRKTRWQANPGLSDLFTYPEARAAGLSHRRIYAMRDAGELTSLGGGLYRRSDAPLADLDLIEIADRVPMATLCLEAALARHGLLDATPIAIDVAIPRGNHRPALKAPHRLHNFDRQPSRWDGNWRRQRPGIDTVEHPQASSPRRH